MDMHANDTSKPSGASSTLRGVLLFSSVLLLLCAVGLPLLERHDEGAREDAQIAEVSQAALGLLQDMQRRCALSVDRAAERLAGVTGPEASRRILLEYAGMYPEANFTLYGPLAEPLISAGPARSDRLPSDGAVPPAAQAASAVAAMVTPESEYTGLILLNDVPGLCAAKSVEGTGRILVVSLPLDADALGRLERTVNAELALMPSVSFAAGRNAGSLVPLLGVTAETSVTPKSADFQVRKLVVKDLARNVGIRPLQNSKGETEALLHVAPLSVVPQPAYWWSRPELPYLFAVCGFLGLFLWWRSKRQALCDTIGAGLKRAIDAELFDLPEAPASLPPSLQATFRTVAEALATRKGIARQAVEHLTEKRTTQAAVDCSGPVSKERSIAGRHYDNAVNGIYQCTTGGAILRINLSFALMLGYDSSLHLQSEHRNMAELFTEPEDAPRILADLREEPHARLPVLFRLRDGVVHPFWLTCFPRTGDESEPMEGFLIDRAPEIALERMSWERDQAQERSASLAKLLAATCLQTQAYFAPRPSGSACDRRETDPATPPVPGQERRRGINSLKDIFDDIYRLAISAAEDAVPAMVPVDVYGLMDRVYRQALPAMAAKNIDLILDVEPGITTTVSASDALLRHTLLRCLFMITAPVSGGSAILGISRDLYTAPEPGTMRLIFSASWLPNMDPPEQPLGADECPPPGNPAADRAMTAPAMSPLDMKDEWAVIEYLVARMNGKPLGSAASHNSRAVQFMIQPNTDAAVEPGKTPAAQPVEAVHDPDDHHYALSGLMDEEAPLPHGELTQEEIAPTLVFDEQVSDEPSLDDGTSTGLDILLVDDSPNTRMLFSLYLKGTKHRITEAHDGREGVDAFGSRDFDVVFMDLEMPLMDGYQATRIIRAMEADAGKKPIPIVAVTGYTLPEARHECLTAGCSEFLAKPFSKNALLSMLEALERQVQKGT